jgi:hypothetical protein
MQFGLPSHYGSDVVVPTSPLGWIFSSGAVSWGIGMLGFIGLELMEKFTKKRQESAKPHGSSPSR